MEEEKSYSGKIFWAVRLNDGSVMFRTNENEPKHLDLGYDTYKPLMAVQNRTTDLILIDFGLWYKNKIGKYDERLIVELLNFWLTLCYISGKSNVNGELSKTLRYCLEDICESEGYDIKKEAPSFKEQCIKFASLLNHGVTDSND